MASEISPRAEVSPKAKIGDNCKIFPFVYIEDDVEIGDNCTIFPFVSILNGTRMGSHNKVHQCSVLGALPQDFDFVGEKSELVIGDNNIIRENVVVNRATHTGGQTVIGNDNFLMEGAHISHDTKVGNACVFGYGTKIAGDCEIGNGVIYSSSVIEKANTRVGEGAYGIDEKIQKHIANAYRLVFHGQTSVFDAVLQIKSQVPDSTEIRNIVNFINATKIGIISKM